MENNKLTLSNGKGQAEQLSAAELVSRLKLRGPMTMEEKELALRGEIKGENIPGFAEANARLGGMKLVG